MTTMKSDMTPVIVNCDSGEREVKALPVTQTSEGLAIDYSKRWVEVGFVWQGKRVIEGLTQPCWNYGPNLRTVTGSEHGKADAIKSLLAFHQFVEVSDLDTIPTLFE